MAQDFSSAFYRSRRWLKCRKEYIAKVNGLCERCNQPGLILHHKILLTPENIGDPDVTLNHDNLEFLCLLCHNEDEFNEHGRKKSPVIRLTNYIFDSNGDIMPPI